MRRPEEFYCSECGKYFITYMRDNMVGNYTIECANPSCQHHHFRVIEHGVVTDDRHNKRYGESEIIPCMPSTLRDTPYHNDPVFRRSQLKAYGVHTHE